MVVPSICAMVWLNCSRAAATLARVVVTASRACESSSCGNRAVRQQPAAPLQVLIRGALRLFPLVDLRAQLLALREQAAHLAHRTRQIRFRVRLSDFRIRRIELEQGLSGAHGLRVIHVQRDHGAGNLAGHLHHVAVHVRIVGGLVVPAVEEPVAEEAQAAQATTAAPNPRSPSRRARADGRGSVADVGLDSGVALGSWCSWACPRNDWEESAGERASASAPEGGVEAAAHGEEQRHSRDRLARPGCPPWTGAQ